MCTPDALDWFCGRGGQGFAPRGPDIRNPAGAVIPPESFIDTRCPGVRPDSVLKATRTSRLQLLSRKT